MSFLLQISSIIAFICWLHITNSTPLFQGFSVHKGFEVNLKPFEFKPIAFFREKWSPFGRFGVRKGIQKRDLEAITNISDERVPSPYLMSPAPVFEQINEEHPAGKIKENIEASAIGIHPSSEPIKPIASNIIRIPSSESFKQSSEGLYTNVGRNPSINNYILEKPAQPVLEEIYGELPPRPAGPISATTAGFIPPKPASFIPSQLVLPVPAQPISLVPAGFGQTVGVNQVQPLVPKEVIPLITPPPSPVVNAAANVPFSEIPPTDGPLVRGSRLALYYGNVFLQLVSQFLTNARLQFTQFNRQPPPPSVANIN